MRRNLICALAIFLGAAFATSLAQTPAQSTGLRVYVQHVKNGRRNDLQGSAIVGFACGPVAGGNATDCYIATR